MKKPRISINKLGEYLTATPSRRKRIVEDQQDPKPFITKRYGDAREQIVGYLASDMTDDSTILQAAENLKVHSGGTDFCEQDRCASSEAIHSFLEASENLDLDGLVAVPVSSNESSTMDVAGVTISMRPDAILKDKETGEVKGCVKLHFPKTTPLNEQGGEYVATALRVHLGNSHAAVDPNKCFVVDVPTKQVYSAPKAFKRKMNDISAACEEIDVRWKKT
jgi:hypothetical protein